MAKSLFHKDTPEDAKPTPHDLIEHEVKHLRKGTSTRHNPNGGPKTPPWLAILFLCALAWLYFMDPVYHAWYKGEAARAYLYLRSFGSATDVDSLVGCQILSPEDIDNLNHRTGSYQDYYTSPEAAKEKAATIVKYMNTVRLLHKDDYKNLDPVSRLRYVLFLKTGLGDYLPIKWTFLDPAINP